MRVLLLLFIFISCEDQAVRDISGVGQDRFALKFQDKGEFVQEFNVLHNQFLGKSIDMKKLRIEMVEELDGLAVAHCQLSEIRVIRIERAYWQRAPKSLKRALMFHELGHCILDRRHNADKVNSIAVSIMYPNLSFYQYYSQYQNAYNRELFKEDDSDIKRLISNYTRSFQSADYQHVDDFVCGNDH